MNRSGEIRASSLPNKPYLNATSLASSYERDEITQRGYLNRKVEGTMGRKTKVLHREKNWQLFWCNLKGTQLDLFKIDGIKLKPGEPPPKDSITPASMIKNTKMEQLNIDGALVELDYVSQENKDIQKRRKFLFRVVSNNIEYIMQAPNMNLRKTWVTALQAVAHHMSVEPEEIMMGHAIKATRDSIKRNTNLTHRNKRAAVVPRITSKSLGEDTDYIEFSTAEAMVAAGGDPRLQALRKRLQAKKELLKQLNRMYTSFLGGNAAAMYDETLMLTQLEPPTFDGGSPILGTGTPDQQAAKKQARRSTYQVVHRKLTLSDSVLDKSLNGGVVNEEENKRESIGEMRLPALSVSPLPNSVDEVVETELLMDYYLVPGAEWSLLKEGEKLQVIGKARDTGWYRCMALREYKVRLDLAPFSFMRQSMLNSSTSGNSKRQSGITPEMIEEEYSDRKSLSIDPLTEIENEDESPGASPPPLIPRSHPSSTSSLGKYTPTLATPTDATPATPHLENITEDTFPDDMELARNSLSKDVNISVPNSPDAASPSEQLKEDPFSDPVVLRHNKAKMEDEDDNGDAGDHGDPGIGRVERRHSYQMATEDTESEILDTLQPPAEQQEKRNPVVVEKIADTIKRSTSSAVNSSQAAITLRKNLVSAKSPRSVSTSVVSGFYPQQSPTDTVSPSSSGMDSAYFSFQGFPSHQVNLDNLVDKEVNTKPYLAPLIGCIPPSALKCFAELESKKDTSLTSPAHSHSDVSAGEPVNTPLESPPEQGDKDEDRDVQDKDDKDMQDKDVQDKDVEKQELEENIIEERKYSNPQILALQENSTSMDEDSDSEADRRLALLFEGNDVINPQEDKIIIVSQRRTHLRAKSLPPPMQLRVDTCDQEEEEKKRSQSPEESSLDRRPSYLRKVHPGGAISPDPSMHIPPCQSVGSSPYHKVHSNGSSKLGNGDQPISSLFESSNKSGIFKKLFRNKSKGPKLTTPEHQLAGRVSPGPAPGTLKRILLHDDYEDESLRARVASVSGRPVVQKGMAIVIGESSSESEDEDDEEGEDSTASSLHAGSSLSILSAQDSPSHNTSTPQQEPPPFLSLDLATNSTPQSGMKRSVSDHSLKMKAAEPPSLQPGTSNSLKRNMTTSLFTKKQRKPRAQTSPSETSQPIKKNRHSKKKKKSGSLSSNHEAENNGDFLSEQDTTIKLSGIFRQPPRGEKRYVYLDPRAGKYGFRLQSYGRIREQGQVLQTFVQSVNPGSSSFMAGLYPGDAIVEVNGVDVKYAPVEEVVDAIQKGGERVALQVEFVDGVTRLEFMRKSDEFKNDIKARQRRLEELRKREESLPISVSPLPSPLLITQATHLPLWADVPLTFEPVQHKFPYDHHLNKIVAVHSGAINSLQCDVLVMPTSSCHRPKESTDKNILLQLLRTGGPGLLDDMSLAVQCKIGENISTWGHNLPAKYIYHCVFGDLEESLQSCCHEAMESASKGKLRTIVFWLDGFISISVSPHIVIDAVRNWLQLDTRGNVFDRVVFSSKANSSQIEKIVQNSFPLYPSAGRDSGCSFTDLETGKDENGTEILQNGNEETPSTEQVISASQGQGSDVVKDIDVKDGDVVKDDGDVKDGDMNISTEDLLESLEAIQEENMKTFEDLVEKLAELPEQSTDMLNVASSPSVFSKSMPSEGFLHLHRSPSPSGRPITPSGRGSHSRSQSGNLILNPDRLESDV